MPSDVSPNVQAVMDQTTQAALQSASQVTNLAMQNAVHMQQLAQTAALQLLTGGMSVHQSYQGSHLRKGAETDAQEAVAEGAVYKGESVASLPQALNQGAMATVIAEVLAKMGISTPPQTGGFSPEAPTGLRNGE